MKGFKKFLTLSLALCMMIPNLAYVAKEQAVVVQAEETTKTWEEWVDGLSDKAAMSVSLKGDDQKFNGSKVLDVSNEYADKLKDVSEGSIIMRFKANSIASNGVILGTSTSGQTLPTDPTVKNANKTSMVITTKDEIYFVYSYERAGRKGPYSFVDGEWHTVIISGNPNGKYMRLTVDGQELWSLSSTTNLLGMFSKQTGLDTVTIGGHKDGDTIIGGFNGEISDVIVTKEVISDEDAVAISAAGYTGGVQMGANIATTMLTPTIRDNTWLFTGGEAAQGGFVQTRGVRNYVGQFEEYIRWRTISGHDYYPRQRYTFNTAAAGQTLASLVENFEERVAAFKTKAVSYLVGKEDYSLGNAGITNFKTNLKSFIDKALALKDGQAFVIIQKPFAVNDAEANANIELYCSAIDEVVAEYKSTQSKYARMNVVDHYSATKSMADFKNNGLVGDMPNATGHRELAKQFAQTVVNYTGTTANFPASNVVLDRIELEQPDTYLEVMPQVNATDTSLLVTISTVEGITEWKYEVITDTLTVSGNASSNTFEIVELPTAKDYVLKIQSKDGQTQLVTTKGTIVNGNEAVKNVQTLSENQQKIVDMVNNSNKPMTWLFMGDSITHASGLTFGYDGIAQIFEEYVKEELGRNQDIVLNTAVANANTDTTLAELDLRLTNYNPDVVSIMIGTNDCSSRVNISVAQFETNVREILDTIQEKYPNAVLLLRSMTPFFNDGNREPYRQSYMDVISKLAEEYDAIYVDQYTALKEATSTYTWLAKNMFTDNLHPEANGHRVMAYMFMKACGLWTEDSPMTNLMYSFGISEETSSIQPEVITGAEQIGLSVEALEKASSLSLGDVVLQAKSQTNGQTYEVSVKDHTAYAILNNLPKEETYTVSVSAHVANAAKKVTFASQSVTLSNDAEAAIEVKLSNKKVIELQAGSKVGSLSVEGLVDEGTYTFTLCEGEGSKDNAFFEIDGDVLKVKKELVEGNSYAIRVKAVCDGSVAENTFVLDAVGEQLIFEESNVNVGTAKDLTSEDYVDKLFAMEEGSFVVKYTSTSTYGVQSLISIGDGTVQNKHFHVYVTPAGRLGVEIRNDSALNYHIYKDGAVVAGAETSIAFKADKENAQYKLFVNGELVYTVSAASLGGFKFVNDITNVNSTMLGATKRGGSNAYGFGGTIESIQVYGAALSDEALKEATKSQAETPEEPEKELQMIFHKNDGTGAYYQRIPALLTLKSGRVIAAADERFGGTHDSPNNIDIGVSVSDDDGKTWSNPELVLYFDDFANDSMEIPRGTQVRVNASASFIDPILFQDAETERVFLIADAFASGYGSPQATSGSGYKTINGKSYMQLKKKGESTYDYSIRENGVIYNDTTNTATEYKVNENYELLKNGVALTVKQKSATFANGSISVTTTDKDVKMNVFYDTADFQVLPTSWLCMKYSDDDGETWSDPIFLNSQVKNDPERIMIVGPGRGLQLTQGEHKGRILVPVYNNAFSGVIYSDDHGDTWTYKRGPITSAAAMSETQFVEMPDGSVRVFARSNGSKIASAVSLDGGETWSDAKYVDGLTQPGWGSQLSVIRYSGLIDGKEAIILSSPAGVGSYRRDGRVKIGLITDTGVEGVDRYTIEWKYDYQVDDTNVGYAYSCLTELENHNVSVLYEKYDSYNGGDLHAQNAMIYEEFSFDQLMNGETATITPIAQANGTVTKRNTVLKGNEVTIMATADEGYVFDKWVSKNGTTISTDMYYTFTLNEDMELTAVFSQATGKEADKSALFALIQAAQVITTENYSDASFAALQDEIKDAIAMYNKKSATQSEVDQAINDLQASIDSLVYDGPRPIVPDDLINKKANDVTVESYSSQCGGTGEPSENGYGQAYTTVDYDEASYWHSNWSTHNGEKHTITYNLGKEYTLTDVTFLPRQAGRNGDIHKFEVYVGNSTDYSQNTLTGEYVFATSGTLDQSQWYRADVKANGEYKGQYVTIRITGSYGDSGNNKFASMSEIRFYGTEEKEEPEVPSVDKSALEQAIIAAEKYEASGYTPESFATLTNAIDKAIDLLGSEQATQEKVDTMVTKLNAAIAGLVTKPVEPEQPEVKAPLAVENLKAEDKAYNKVALTWEPSEGATEYDVYQKAHDSEKFEFVATVSEAEYTATVPMTGKENKFYVVAKNEAGEADASKEVAKATTLHGTVKLNMKKVSTAKFELSWNKIAGATRYIIYSKRGSDEWKKVLTLGKDKLSYVTAELPNGEYSYIIRAARYDSSDRVMTAKSNAKTGTVEAIAPTVTVKVSGTKATLTWDKLEGVTYYQVFRKTSKEGKYTVIKTTSAQKYTANVSKTKTYYFKVRGYKAYKSGANSKYNVYTPYSAAKAVKGK